MRLHLLFVAALMLAANSFGAYSWGQPASIDTTKNDSDLTNFPVYVYDSALSLKTTGNGGKVQSATGLDVGFASNSACTVMLKWDMDNYNATLGTVRAWVLKDVHDYGTPDSIYICYGDAGISTYQGDSVNVWPNYQLVSHNKDGTTLTPVNSTGDATYNGTVQSATAIVGKADGGARMVSTSQYITHSTAYRYALTSSFTLEGWFWSGSGTSDNNLLGNQAQAGPNHGTWIGQSLTGGDGRLYWSMYSGAQCAFKFPGTYKDSAWHYVAVPIFASAGSTCTSDTANIWGYIDGAKVLKTWITTTLTASPTYAANFQQNSRGGGSNGGVIKWDEVRVSSIARSAKWIKSTYNNVNSPDTYVLFGTEYSIGGSSGWAYNFSGVTSPASVSGVANANIVTISGK